MYRLTQYQFSEFTQKSQAWDEATGRINDIITVHNRNGIPVSEEQRKSLHEARVLYTMQQEPELFREVAQEVYEDLIHTEKDGPISALFREQL